jgi:hypothetical protein
MTVMACSNPFVVRICPRKAAQSVTNAAIKSRLLYNSGRPKPLESRYLAVACAI